MSQDNTVAITICGDTEPLDNFIAALKQTRWLSQTNIEHYFTQLSTDEDNYYYCLLEDIDWDDIHQTECDALCKIADTYQLSYYVCRLNTRDKKRFECSNAGEDYFNWHVKWLFRVEKQYHFVDNRYKTLKEWVIAHYEHNTLADMVNHGCSGGFPRLTYYFETVALYNHYQECIWDMLDDDYECYGHQNIVEMIGAFNGAKNVGSDDQLKNLLVWHSVEKIANDITGGEYKTDDDDSNDDTDDDDE